MLSPSVDTNMASAGGSVITKAMSTNASEIETFSCSGITLSSITSVDSGQQSVLPSQSVSDSVAATAGDHSSVPPPRQNSIQPSISKSQSNSENVSVNDNTTVHSVNNLNDVNNVNNVNNVVSTSNPVAMVTY